MIWNFDPVLFSFNSFAIHWYGIIFTLSIFTGFHLTKKIFAWESQPVEDVDSLLSYVVLGVIIGARLGHCFFYEPQYYFENPLRIFAIWEGGLASHGGGIGAMLGILIYAKKHGSSFIWLLDRITPATVLFGACVRVANFLNSEIIGDESTLPWVIVFERVDNVSRHPVQLYEAGGYFIIFLALLTVYTKTNIRKYQGALLGLFLTTVFTLRFFVEFVKEPQASYSMGINLNTGQILSIPFVIFGFVILILVTLQRRWTI